MEDIIVVEGTHDEIKIKSVYPNAQCVVTNGSQISEDTLKYIKELSKTHNIIIMTDPDYPGERIRNKVLEVVPNASHAFIRKPECISKNKKKVGIEHASKECIVESLQNVYNYETNEDVITIQALYKFNLTGSKDSQIRRDKISDYLNIGKPNAKTFLKRLNLLKIDEEKLKEIICKLKLEM